MVSDSCLVTKSCLTLCDPMDSSPPGSFVLWILQARILDWVAISFSRKKKKDILYVIFGKQIWSTSFNFYVLNLIQGGRHAGADGACTVSGAASRPAPFPAPTGAPPSAYPSLGKFICSSVVKYCKFVLSMRWEILLGRYDSSLFS